MKQFGLSLEEVLSYSNFQPDYAAILSASIPTSQLENFDVSGSIDPLNFKSGVVTVNGQAGLDLLNSIVTNIEQAH